MQLTPRPNSLGLRVKETSNVVMLLIVKMVTPSPMVYHGITKKRAPLCKIKFTPMYVVLAFVLQFRFGVGTPHIAGRLGSRKDHPSPAHKSSPGQVLIPVPVHGQSNSPFEWKPHTLAPTMSISHISLPSPCPSLALTADPQGLPFAFQAAKCEAVRRHHSPNPPCFHGPGRKPTVRRSLCCPARRYQPGCATLRL